MTVATLGTIPFATGLLDIVAGPDSIPGGAGTITSSLDSEFRFASTFWAAVGPVLWSQVPNIDGNSPVLPVALGTVFAGGFARLLSWRSAGRPHPVFVGATALELVGMPLVLAWHRAVVRRRANAAGS